MLAQADIGHLYGHGKSHGEVQIALRDLKMQSRGKERNAADPFIANLEEHDEGMPAARTVQGWVIDD